MTAEGQKGFGLHRHSQIIEKGLWQFTKSFCKSCQMIIAPTDSVAKDLKQQKFTNRISVLPAGIDLSLVERNGQRKKTLKEQLDLKGLIILGVGRISREKDWELLLGAMARLYMRKKRYTLVLIGKGPYEDELRFLARTLGIEHRVRFLGEIPHQDLIKDGYYQIGDVFAMPSSFETQGLVTLEAMAFGLPIVGVKAAGTVDLIKSTGLFSKKSEEDLADKLNQILEDVSLRHRLSKQSLLKANDFGLDKIVVQLEAVYLNLLRKSEA
jgi:glycosyltransferase involved in cell wall biosynthesis